MNQREESQRKLFLLDDQVDVYKHPAFIILTLVPLACSIFLAIELSADYHISLSNHGYSTFLEISKLPLGVASLSFIFGVMFFRIHASKQKTRLLNTSLHQNRLNNDISRDSEHLELIRESFENVYELLKDKTNDNILWIRASRLLLEALSLKSNIVTPTMKKAAELSVTQLRAKLYDVLTFSVDETNSRQALPAQFFYGIKDWKTEESIDEAARKSSKRIKANRIILDKVPPTPTSTSISSKAVIAIYDFLEFPNDYDDPLDKVLGWQDNWADINGPAQGAARYVYHRKVHSIFDGKIHKKN